MKQSISSVVFIIFSFTGLLVGIGCSKGGKDFSTQQSSSSSNGDGSVATITFSETQSGTGKQSFGTSVTIYGKVTQSGQGATACLEKFGYNDGFCQLPSNYTSMPNKDWHFDASSGNWQATFSPGAFTEGTYKMYWKNSGSNKAAFVSIQILDGDKPLMVAVEYPYNKPETTYQQFEAIYFLVTNAPSSGSQFCREIVGKEDGVCLAGNSWVTVPGNGWTYSSTIKGWEALVRSGTSPVGAFRFFWRNANTKSVSTPMIITVSADTGPTLVFSKTEFGGSSSSFNVKEDFYAYVINGDPNNSYSCLDNVSAHSTSCSSDSNFTKMPNSDWSFSTVNQRWEARFGPSTTVLSNTSVNLNVYWKNGSTGKKSPATSLSLVK